VNDKIKVISDLDGTLLNKQHKNIRVYQNNFRTSSSKYLIIIATGRHHLDAIPIIEGEAFHFT
jgi:hydroxymethylpyrimidine pyrophosphatase-like HAD family hydrolase